MHPDRAIFKAIEKKNAKDGVIVFGTGYAGQMVMYILKYIYKLKNITAFDNAPLKNGKVYWNDIRCTLPTALGDDTPVLICIFNPKVSESVRKQCEELGYQTIMDVSEDDIADRTAEFDERKCIELMYFCKTGERLELDAPRNYNEKIQWLKLYDHNPQYKKLTDKLAVKEFVRDRIGDEHVIPTLGVWNGFDEIDFSLLPNQFVLKCTHDSGSVEIIRNKSDIDDDKLQEKFSAALNRDYYFMARESSYIGVPHRIIAEPILSDHRSDSLKDYKVFTFDGEPKIVQVDYDRFENHSRIMYSADWENLGFSTMYPYDASKEESRPAELDELLYLSRCLARGLRHVRVDFYIADGKIFFGEMTFYHGGGYEKFSDEKWNIIMGDWLKIPVEK